MRTVQLTDAQHAVLCSVLLWVDAAGDRNEFFETTPTLYPVFKRAQAAVCSATFKVGSPKSLAKARPRARRP